MRLTEDTGAVVPLAVVDGRPAPVVFPVAPVAVCEAAPGTARAVAVV
ncbi:hypothetical protein NE850_11330 [Paraburkholderia sp. USG1]|nr:hypothetical protein [Paraburkholderia sp. USG1]